MKTFGTLSAILLFALVAFNSEASNISRSCTNASGTILIKNFSTLKVVTGMYAADNSRQEQSVTFDLRQDVNVDVKNSQIVDEETGCSFSATTSIEKVTISKLNGERMPDAYSKNADKDGTLSDILLCKETKSWMPSPGICN
jgi:hypothetical protein